MRRLPLFALVLLLPLLLLLAACGDDGGDDDGEEDGAAADTVTVGEAAEDDPVLDGVSVEGEFGEEMTVEVDAPLEVETTVRRIIEEGDGDPLEAGMSVTFENVALNGRDGAEFDNSFETGTPPPIVMDETQIIPGLIRGLVDVPVGSRVVIASAPQDAFQEQGGLPDAGIEADDTLVFVIDVLEAEVPLDRAEGDEVDPVDGLPTVELDGETGQPTITLPDDDPPDELVAQPLIEGEGDEVEEGQTLSVHYTGIVWPGGEQFDSSWDRGEPASFPIGVGNVIEGWDEGLVGRTVGTQMLLVIPPEQGYGEEGNPDAGIEGTDTLVFVVDILGAS